MLKHNAGFKELEHTADVALEVWGPTMESLLEQAAKGMYSITQTELQEQKRAQMEIHLEASDLEGLLVDFLNELLYLGESQGLAFDKVKMVVNGTKLSAIIIGAPVKRQVKEIKAVTYHNLNIHKTENGLLVRIVFDV